ncbi:MAG: transcriptional regulator [Nitrospirae bacterium]|nr:transcriptional regulator [Nitrospirota bacterium]
MSYKFDSMIIILNKIDGQERVTAKTLTNDLEVSERTAYRYIQTLQVAGFPIIYDKQKESYVFSEGYSLRKPNLTLEENLAFSLSKKLLRNFGEGMEKSLQGIEDKLAIKKTDALKHIILSAEELPAFVGVHLAKIHQAIMNYQKIEIAYNAIHVNEESRRRIYPYYLFFREGFWYMRGYCHLSKGLRTFALDRIMSLKTLDEHFMPANAAPENELSSSFGAWLDGKPTEVVLRFDSSVKQQVLRRKWHQSQKTKELKDGRLEVRFTVNGTGGIKKWIYQWIPNVEVIAPKALREDFLGALNKACERNKKSGK